MVYLFFKSRSGNVSNGLFSFLSGNGSQQDNKVDDQITLMMINQFFNSSTTSQERGSHRDDVAKHDRDQEIENTKKEILKLLEED